MEARAKHEFKATASDELSFKKDDKVKILSMEDDKNWFKAEKGGLEGWIPTNYISLEPTNWFVGNMKRTDAEAMLLEKTDHGDFLHPDGAFVVRKSESSPGDFSLSVKFERSVQHFKVLRDAGGKYFLWVVKFDSVNDLVKYHRQASVSRTHTVYLQDRIAVKRVADYDYSGQDEHELSFKRGDLITVVDKSDPNWWEGQVERDGKCCRGLFPITYTSQHN